jgi:hypothetical protein
MFFTFFFVRGCWLPMALWQQLKKDAHPFWVNVVLATLAMK